MTTGSAGIAAEGARTSAAAVANAFLDLQASDHSGYPPIDPMKMQKLLFYAQAWWLAYHNSPLFGEDIEAWPWGPVVGAVYGKFRSFGRQPIVGQRATMLERTGPGPFEFKSVEPPAPDGQVMAFLKQVWDIHKGLTGIQLSNATHADGEPWTVVKRLEGSLDSKPRIPNALIRDIFKAKLAKSAH